MGIVSGRSFGALNLQALNVSGNAKPFRLDVYRRRKPELENSTVLVPSDPRSDSDWLFTIETPQAIPPGMVAIVGSNDLSLDLSKCFFYTRPFERTHEIAPKVWGIGFEIHRFVQGETSLLAKRGIV